MTYNLLCPNNRVTYKIWEGFWFVSLAWVNFQRLSSEKARPWNPKRRCLWLLKRKPRRKPKRKRSKYGVVGLWWWFKPSLLSGKQGNRSGYLIHRALQWLLGGPCVFGLVRFKFVRHEIKSIPPVNSSTIFFLASLCRALGVGTSIASARPVG